MSALRDEIPPSEQIPERGLYLLDQYTFGDFGLKLVQGVQNILPNSSNSATPLSRIGQNSPKVSKATDFQLAASLDTLQVA